MKSISITSIICGTLIVLTPMFHNLALMAIVAALIHEGHGPVNLSVPLDNSYNGWCLFVGMCVIVSGMVIGVRSRSAQQSGHGAVAPAAM